MRELALAQEILLAVLDAAGDQPVRRVDVRVGALQLLAPESLQLAFQSASEGTLAQNAALRIQEVPARLRCKQCRVVTIARQPPFRCERCSSAGVEIVSGEEVQVDAVELENGAVLHPSEAASDQILKEHRKEQHAIST